MCSSAREPTRVTLILPSRIRVEHLHVVEAGLESVSHRNARPPSAPAIIRAAHVTSARNRRAKAHAMRSGKDYCGGGGGIVSNPPAS